MTISIELIEAKPSQAKPAARAEQLMAGLAATANAITTDVAVELMPVE